MLGEELDSLWPQTRESLGIIVEIDGETICFVVVVHVTEDIIVDLAEEVDVGLDAPVVSGIREGGVLVEEPAIPTAHLVIRSLAGILDTLVLENRRRLVEYIVVDPGRRLPVLGRDDF